MKPVDDSRNNKKKKLIANHLINFRFEKTEVKSTFQPQGGNGRRKSCRSQPAYVSKAQFMQSNFRFLVLPSVKNETQECFQNPDCLVRWNSVISVIVPLVDSLLSICPICLDHVHSPKITECGHIFCHTCILQHLSVFAASNKCPICTDYVSEKDLKTVKFVDAETYKNGDSVTLQLLVINSATIFPQLPILLNVKDSRGQYGSGLSAIFESDHVRHRRISGSGYRVNNAPAMNEASAKFSRILCMSSDDQVRAFLIEELRELAVFRRACLQQGSVSNSSGASSAKSSLSETSNKNPSRTVSWSSVAAKKATVASNEVPIACAQHLLDGVTVEEAANIEAIASGDVEYLPYIQLAQNDLLRRLGALTDILKDSVPTAEAGEAAALCNRDVIADGVTDCIDSICSIRRPASNQPATNHQITAMYENGYGVDLLGVPGGQSVSVAVPANLLSSTAILNSDTNNMKDGHSRTSTSANVFYQSANGEAAYLHPLCMKCLLAQALDRNEKNTPTSPMLSQCRVFPSRDDIQDDASAVPSDGSGYCELSNTITAIIVEIEAVKVTSTIRKRIPYLRHLPENCSIALLEIDLRGIVNESILARYSTEFEARNAARFKRAQKLAREAAHEAESHMLQEAMKASMKIREQQMLSDLFRGPDLGKVSEGPVFDFPAPALPTPSPSSALRKPRSRSSGSLDSFGACMHSSQSTSAKAVTVNSTPPHNSGGNKILKSNSSGFSFANVTKMGGDYPSLSLPPANTTAQTQSQEPSYNKYTKPSPGTAAWGASSANSDIAVAVTAASGCNSGNNIDRGLDKDTSVSVGRGTGAPGVSCTPSDEIQATSAGKAKNTKKISLALFSNSSSRSYKA